MERRRRGQAIGKPITTHCKRSRSQKVSDSRFPKTYNRPHTHYRQYEGLVAGPSYLWLKVDCEEVSKRTGYL